MHTHQHLLCYQDNNNFQQLQKLGQLTLFLDAPLLCLFSDLPKSNIHSHYLTSVYCSNTTKYLKHPTAAKLAKYGIATFTFSANCLRKLPFFPQLANFLTADNYFGFLHIRLWPFSLQWSFPIYWWVSWSHFSVCVSRTMLNDIERRTETQLKSTWTRKSWPKELTSHSSTPDFGISHQTNILGT